MTAPSKMRLEINEIPEAAERLIQSSQKTIQELSKALKEKNAAFVATVARGSSDHAANYLKYIVEMQLGLPVASLGPSVASIYGSQLNMPLGAMIAISQSGKSPDIVAMAENARRGGSFTVAFTNVTASPLASACDVTLDIQAGPELSVAATKTFVNSVVAGLLLVAGWTTDRNLMEALHKLPASLETAVATDWSALGDALEGRHSLYILGRGPAYAIACEAALKFKETSGMHAEAYSSAEVMHGPVSIVGEGFPVLALAARDKAQGSIAAIADSLVGQGARVFITSDVARQAKPLPYAATGHPLTDALVQIASFYGFVEMLARKRGYDPDQPRHLRKVTETT
jgi:glutamine---fructose-6-phosphate transaminase (isomerizing)